MRCEIGSEEFILKDASMMTEGADRGEKMLVTMMMMLMMLMLLIC